MPYATDADLLARVAEMASVALTTRDLARGDAKLRLSDVAVGQRTLQAHVYLTAHILTIWSTDPTATTVGGGEASPIASMSAAEISVSYAVIATGAETYNRTRWGRAYLEIMNDVHNRPAAV